MIWSRVVLLGRGVVSWVFGFLVVGGKLALLANFVCVCVCDKEEGRVDGVFMLTRHIASLPPSFLGWVEGLLDEVCGRVAVADHGCRARAGWRWRAWRSSTR